MAPIVRIREVEEADLPVFFEHQRDPVAGHMVALLGRDPHDRAAFDAHWQKILQEPQIITRAILADEQLAGQLVQFFTDGKPEVGYWLGREYWSQGIATEALALFLKAVPHRPLYAHTAQDNHGSVRVLQKNGFRITDEGEAYSIARQETVKEYVMELNDSI